MGVLQKKIKIALPFADSLKDRLFLSFFAMIFFVCCIISISTYYMFRGIIINEIGRSRTDLLKQVGERTSGIIETTVTLSNLYYYDPQVYKLLLDKTYGDRQSREMLYEMGLKYGNAFESLNYSFNVVILSDQGFVFSSNNNLNSKTYDLSKMSKLIWYNRIFKEEGDIYWVSSFNDAPEGENARYVFSAARVLKDGNSGKNVGVLLINVEEKVLSEVYKNILNKSNNIYIVDGKGSIVSHKDNRMLGTNFIDMKYLEQMFEKRDYTIIKKANEGTLISKYTDPNTGWVILEEIPLKDVLAPLYKIQTTIIFILVFSLLLALLLSVLQAKRIVKPLNAFCSSMESVRNGTLNKISEIDGWREIKQICGNFNEMIETVKKLLKDIREKDTLKRKADLDCLQAQINPHFMYNTLFSIKCMVAMGERNASVQMINAFINLLKRTLKTDSELVPLEEEFESLKQYALIQSYRYSNKFSLEINIDDELIPYKIPRLILQPLIENAIFHGIEPKNGNGLIRIGAFLTDQDIVIEVNDDGVGMDQSQLESIWLKKDNSGSNDSIGIYNIHNRIQLYFGSKYGLQIESKKNAGTKAIVTIPAIN